MFVSPEVYTELVSLMLSGYDIATSRFQLVRSVHYIATVLWYFYKKKSLTLVLVLSQLPHLLSVFILSLAIRGTCAPKRVNHSHKGWYSIYLPWGT